MSGSLVLGLTFFSGCAAFGSGASEALFGLGADDSTTPGDDDGTPDQGGGNDDNATGGGEVVTPPSDDATAGACGACRFDRYNLDVRVGDTFLLTNFLSCGDALSSHSFSLDGGDWAQLDAINAGLPITITDADLQGGNHGEGEYRINLLDADGEELDHATVRINHDDVSDITAADAVDHAPVCGASGGEVGGDVGSDDGTADQGGGNADDDNDDDDDGAAAGDDDGTADQGGANDDDDAATGDDGTADQGGGNDDDAAQPQG